MEYKEKLEQNEKDMQDIDENYAKVKRDLNMQLIESEKQVKEKENVIMSKDGEIATLKASLVEEKAMAYHLTEENK